MTNLFSREGILALLVSIPGLLLAISMHECAHGYAAYFMGDRTAKYSGRLSLNPLHHLDLVGTLCMLFFHFGWAKPVPINPNNFKRGRLGIIVVSLAGPFANFIIGLLSALIYLYILLFVRSSAPIWDFLQMVFLYSTYMNIGLMIFNLIPIPPLDGSKILMEFLPYRIKYQIYRYERYFGLILILLVYMGTMTPILSALQGVVLDFYQYIANLVFMPFLR